MPAYGYAILAGGYLAWALRFVWIKRKLDPVQRLDPSARWGMLLEVIAFAILWMNPFWARPLPPLRAGIAASFFTLAALLSWTAVRALGRQWRVDAAIASDHELVTTGPYRLIRHPIYTSMLCLLLGTGFLITPFRTLLVAVVLFVVGMEVRVRVEDRLLTARFGDKFIGYQRSVRAYLPFVR